MTNDYECSNRSRLINIPQKKNAVTLFRSVLFTKCDVQDVHFLDSDKFRKKSP